MVWIQRYELVFKYNEFICHSILPILHVLDSKSKRIGNFHFHVSTTTFRQFIVDILSKLWVHYLRE